MRKLLSSLLFLPILGVNAQVSSDVKSDFNAMFRDSTLRIDYNFTGTSQTQEIALDELHVSSKGQFLHIDSAAIPPLRNV